MNISLADVSTDEIIAEIYRRRIQSIDSVLDDVSEVSDPGALLSVPPAPPTEPSLPPAPRDSTPALDPGETLIRSAGGRHVIRRKPFSWNTEEAAK